MSSYRASLPQLVGGVFLTDAGLETDFIFNRGIPVRCFAAHTLLTDPRGRDALWDYFRSFLSLAARHGAGFILNSQTWKAHLHWAEQLGANETELRQANEDSVAFIRALREEYSSQASPIVLNGLIGPRGDGYAAGIAHAAEEAEVYHARQIQWLAATDIDMVTGTTLTRSAEAVGMVRAGRAAGIPVVISFTVERDGKLPSGQPLSEAILQVDAETDSGAAYFMVNCAHPDHFFHVLKDGPWARRLRGLRCNASRLSHAELDQCGTLDAGDPEELGRRYREISRTLPWIRVWGGCCGTDLRHVTEIARSVLG